MLAAFQILVGVLLQFLDVSLELLLCVLCFEQLVVLDFGLLLAQGGFLLEGVLDTLDVCLLLLLDEALLLGKLLHHTPFLLLGL